MKLLVSEQESLIVHPDQHAANIFNSVLYRYHIYLPLRPFIATVSCSFLFLACIFHKVVVSPDATILTNTLNQN